MGALDRRLSKAAAALSKRLTLGHSFRRLNRHFAAQTRLPVLGIYEYQVRLVRLGLGVRDHTEARNDDQVTHGGPPRGRTVERDDAAAPLGAISRTETFSRSKR